MKEIDRNEDIVMLIKKEKIIKKIQKRKYTFKEKGWYFKVVNRRW